MSKDRLRKQVFPPGTDSVLVRATIHGKLAGHVFATRWEHEGRKICWITQLCVDRDFRRKSLATKVCFPNTFRTAATELHRCY
jgi:hypothetical protein